MLKCIHCANVSEHLRDSSGALGFVEGSFLSLLGPSFPLWLCKGFQVAWMPLSAETSSGRKPLDRHIPGQPRKGVCLPASPQLLRGAVLDTGRGRVMQAEEEEASFWC